MTHSNALTCDMSTSCAGPVSMIDDKGYIYCAAHGLARRGFRPCRKLRAHEIKRLASGEPLTRY